MILLNVPKISQRIVNISEHLHPFLGFWIWELFLSKVLQSLLATTFPTTSSRAVPLQLPHLLRSGRMPGVPRALPFLSFPIASVSSSMVGTSASWSLAGFPDFCFIKLVLDIQYSGEVSPPPLLCFYCGAWIAFLFNHCG